VRPTIAENTRSVRAKNIGLGKSTNEYERRIFLFFKEKLIIFSKKALIEFLPIKCPSSSCCYGNTDVNYTNFSWKVCSISSKEVMSLVLQIPDSEESEVSAFQILGGEV